MKITAEIAVNDGTLYKVEHESTFTKTLMKVNVFIPKVIKQSEKIPFILYLSGLTCTPDNASEKSMIIYFASLKNLAVVLPDTSPRGAGIEGEDDNWDFGTGAGFYVDSINKPWNENYNMYSYINTEIFQLINDNFPIIDTSKCGITGHSMGGYGAIMMHLRNEGKFKSCSAFAPISNPSIVPWGEKCFGNYLGNDKTKWEEYDPCCLIKKINKDRKGDILIHVGDRDVFNYRDNQLRCENLVEASKGTNWEIDLNVVKGYDHSYYFVSSFMKDHIEWHYNRLNK